MSIIYRKMLVPSCLTSLDRKYTHKTRNWESPQSKDILRLILYQEHSLTLDMCKDHCTVAGLWYSTLPGLRFLSPLLQPVSPLHHFSRNARKWVVLKSLSKRSMWYYMWLVSHTAMRYLPFLPPSHHLQSQWWFGILFITPHIRTRGHCL